MTSQNVRPDSPQDPNATRLSRRKLLGTGLAGGTALAAATLTRTHGIGAAPAAPAVHLSSSKASTTELSFWKPPHGQRDAELFKALFDEFSQQHSDLKVTHNIVPWNSVDESFTAAFAGGNPPDVFYLPDEWYPKYVRQGQIADLSSTFGDLEDQYDPTVWSVGSYKGKLWGVPFLAVVHALLLNMSLFEAAGLEAPKDWAGIQEAAKTLTDTSKGVYGFGISFDAPWNYLTTLLGASGTTILNDDLTKVTANSDSGVAAFEAGVRKLWWDDKSTVPIGTTNDHFTDLSLKGQVAMMWTEESSIKAQWRKEAPDTKLDVIPLPPVEGTEGAPAVWTNSGFLFISEHSKHKDEAVELVKFLASKHVQEEYVLKGVDLISPMKGVTAIDVDPIVAKFLSYMPHGVGPVMSVHWSEAGEALGQDAQAVMSGQRSSEEALNDFADNINGVLDGE
jgi:multiple sugar transport system substrate-binding protein